MTAESKKNDKNPSGGSPSTDSGSAGTGDPTSGTTPYVGNVLNLTINSDPDINISVLEKNGTLEFTFLVKKGTGDVRLGDLQGIFFNLDENYLESIDLSVSQEALKVTGAQDQLYAIEKDSLSKIQAQNRSINVEGEAHSKYDIAVRFGSNGAGKDYVTQATFTLSSLDPINKPLTLDLINGESFALRLTSVGAESTSLKLTGKFNPGEFSGGETGGGDQTGGDGTQPRSPADGTESGAYDDLIEAGDHNDFIHGGRGNDEMQGEGGNDTIYGGTDRGEIAWTPGKGKLNKVLIGDNLYGNDGQDTYRYAKGDGVDMIWDFRPGDDVIELSGYSLADLKATWVGKVANWIDTPKHTKLALTFSDGGAIVFNDYSGLDTSTAAALRLADGTVLSFAQLVKMAGAKPEGAQSNDDRNVAARSYGWRDIGKDKSLYGGNDVDKLLGGSGDDNLYGNEGVNGLNGKDGNDQLFGGNTRDSMLGGNGDDIGYGNGGDDLIIGGSGADRLYGTGGTDYIFGDEIPEGIVLPSSFSRDLLWTLDESSLTTSSNTTLDEGVSNIAASGNAAIALTGNSLNNVISGNRAKNTIKAGQGDDVINGGYGNDTLYGESGEDIFVFDTKLGTSKTDRTVNFDTVGDFSVKNDSFYLDDAVFKNLGKGSVDKPIQLKKGFFTIGTEAEDKKDYVIYNKSTGVLSYDADGSEAGKAVEFAKVKKGLTLTYKDFFVI
jgi:Ca2+-binding RTX toxin-like protein